MYKYCKETQVGEAGFDQKRESAFQEVESGVASGNGFYAASYGSVYVMGQCEGDLEGAECGDCVRTALERAKAECGEAISGQVYLNQCYISYSYYPDGVGDSDEKATSSPGKCTSFLPMVLKFPPFVAFIVYKKLLARSIGLFPIGWIWWVYYLNNFVILTKFPSWFNFTVYSCLHS